MLPSGMTLNQASLGFKNQGQFIAALHVSQNLGIPFADLKTAMTGIRPVTTTGGTTGTTGTTSSGSTSGSTSGSSSDSTTTLSLGQAIKKLRPGADIESATDLAERQATRDVRVTTTSTTSTSTSATSTSSTSTTTSATTTPAKRHGK